MTLSKKKAHVVVGSKVYRKLIATQNSIKGQRTSSFATAIATRTAALKAGDKKVVRSFMDHQPMEGRILETNGQVLRTTGYMGSGATIAYWVDDDYVSVLEEYSSRTEQSAANFVRKQVPENWLRSHDLSDTQQQSRQVNSSLMTVEEIYALLDDRGVDAASFWDHAMGGDRADLPREDVERCIEEITKVGDPASILPNYSGERFGRLRIASLFRSHTKQEITDAISRGEQVWQLDTANFGEDDLLIGDYTEVIAAVLHHFELLELPEKWSLDPVDWRDINYYSASTRTARFMEPVVEHGEWGVIRDDEYDEILIVPGEYADDPAVLGNGVLEEMRTGWGAQMSAPGYMDQTEWDVFDTEQEAWDHLKEHYMSPEEYPEYFEKEGEEERF